MRITDFIGRRCLFFDGAMGTELQKAGLPPAAAPDLANMLMPDRVKAIHRAYLVAGANIIKTNTFGCNALKLKHSDYTVMEITKRAVGLAREAVEEAETAGVSGPHFIAMDIGPSGKLLSPLGDLDFEMAVESFREAAIAGAEAGADCILIETISDTYELKAAVLAAKETGLPVLATVSVDAQGRLLTGADMATVAALLEGLRVDAMGLNCGYGAEALLPHLAQLSACSSLPLILNPNAGLPRQQGGQTVYDQTPEQFAAYMEKALQSGASLLGGCCGTTPAHIAALTDRLSGAEPLLRSFQKHTVVSSGSRAVTLHGRAPVLIGERINPTGKPAMKRAILEGSVEYMLREALRQQACGAEILDVNVGLPGIDEALWLEKLSGAIQAVCDLPLQLDTANPKALEAALKRYNGKAMINSVSGKQESMDTVFPLVRRYGGVVVALTLDETGIPETAEGRLQIAARIVETAARYGIGKHDLVIDPLTMAVSAAPDAAIAALKALRLIRTELGAQTVLGVSNISFGLPVRSALNTAFFTMASEAGLSAAILNPYTREMMNAYHAARVLLGEDAGCAAYVAALGEQATENTPMPVQTQSLRQAIKQGLEEEARTLAQALVNTVPPMEIVETELIPALNDVGADFENNKAFLPQLLRSAGAAKAAFEVLGRHLPPKEHGGRGTVVIATVHGDIHDIGKNIVRAMLESYRFNVIDLGRDVPPEKIVEAARDHDARLVGLSALMTTTVSSMEVTIRLLHEALPGCRIMAGGAVLSEAYAREIGADKYVRDAMESVRYAQEVLEGDVDSAI